MERLQFSEVITWNSPGYLLPEPQTEFEINIQRVSVLLHTENGCVNGAYNIPKMIFFDFDGEYVSTDQIKYWAYSPKLK